MADLTRTLSRWLGREPQPETFADALGLFEPSNRDRIAAPLSRRLIAERESLLALEAARRGEAARRAAAAAEAEAETAAATEAPKRAAAAKYVEAVAIPASHGDRDDVPATRDRGETVPPVPAACALTAERRLADTLRTWRERHIGSEPSPTRSPTPEVRP